MHGQLKAIDFAPGQIPAGPAGPAETASSSESDEKNDTASRANTCP